MAKNQTPASPAPEPSPLIPRITFKAGFLAFDRTTRIKPGGTLNFSDPQHQKLLKWAIGHLTGAAIDFIPATQAASVNDQVSSIATAQAEIARAQASLDGFEKTRQSELSALANDLTEIKALGLSESLKFPGASQEEQLAAFLASEEGIALAQKKSGIEARIKQVQALIASARAGTDSTLHVSMANTDLANAKKNLAALQSPVVAVPAASSAGPTSPAGTAAT